MRWVFSRDRCLAVLATIAALTLLGGQARAHGFNVALVVPLSGPAAAEGAHMRDGFLLAAGERDAHANQESDGHLGGLDVYVYPADGLKMDGTEFKALLERQAIDIVAAIGPAESVASIESLSGEAKAVVLTAGETPFPGPAQTATGGQVLAVAAFIEAFQKTYGYAATPFAAQGYHTARRIDAAVRAQGGIDDRDALRQHLERTERGFEW